MSELNAEQIKKALECCHHDDLDDCPKCPYNEENDGTKKSCFMRLMEDSLELINELTEENERLSKHNVVLIEDNHILATEFKEITRADTVRKMAVRLAVHFGTYTDKDMVKIREVFRLIDQIAKEMLEEKDEK